MRKLKMWWRRLFCKHPEKVWLTQIYGTERPMATFPLAVCQHCHKCMWGTQSGGTYTFNDPVLDAETPMRILSVPKGVRVETKGFKIQP
jgi:hypothetical protein